MGNKAVIARDKTSYAEPCLYLHWNGGLASVEAFLMAAKELGLDPKDKDFFTSFGRLLADSFFKTTLNESTVYVQFYCDADRNNWDNGTYLIDDNMEIVRRRYKQGPDEVNEKKTQEIYQTIITNTTALA